MKKYIGLLIVVIGSITAYLWLTKQEVSLNAEIQTSNEVFTASSVSEYLQHKAQSSSQTLNSLTENSITEAIDPNSGLTRSEAEILVAWIEPRGYRGAPGDYDSMSDETLTALANQNDPKAHMLLAIRLLKDPGNFHHKLWIPQQNIYMKHRYSATPKASKT